ncbi:TIGR03085 family protein [Marmoricola endophyticus]|uniref:TIGR03085 family protein n=1 Tax=Marmoricola endophyticus TaxID=2040280 RepID=A0A917BCP8_9ACTN|nr:TIGR03085 family metal-binding protein [Marmoricola endophyticus]GGF32119.1 TIGR03085 family protein [Marmoricola endophyticus]
MSSFVDAERHRLGRSALDAGADAPTLCGDWTVHDLLVHLVVREGDLLAMPGIAIGPLWFLTDRAMRRHAGDPLPDLVERLSVPPLWSPFRLPVVDRTANTLELVVHHEDVRRAAASWEPRTLAAHEQREVWRALGMAGVGLVRPAGVPVRISWPGQGSGSDRVRTLRRGDEPVTVSGEPVELAMFLFGRDQHRGLTFEGPDARVAALREASLGF